MLRPCLVGVAALAILSPSALGSGWSQPEPLSLFDGDPGAPAIITGEAGGARAAWSQGGALASADRVPATPWSLPERTDSAVSDDVRLAILPGNETLAVWIGPDGLSAAVREDGGPWGEPELLDVDGPAPVGLRLASTLDGEAVAVWSFGTGGGVLSASYIDGEWGDVTSLAGEEPGADPDVALDDDGRAIAAWRAAGNRLAAAVRDDNGDWGEPEVVTASGTPGRSAPRVVLGDDDTALATWREPDQIAASARADDGSWSAPVRVSSASRPGSVIAAGRAPEIVGPQVAADGDGQAVVWVESSTGRLLARRRDETGIWGAIDALSASRETSSEPRVSVDAEGTLRIVWIQGNGTASRVRATERPAAGAFAAPVNLSRRQGEVHDLALSIAGDGNALAGWLRDTSEGGLVVVARSRTEAACAVVPIRPYPSASDGAAQLTARQLGINQRIAQAAVRRASAIERWFDDGLQSGDFCGAGLDHDDLAPGITRVFAGVPPGTSVFPTAEPRPVVVAPAGPGGGNIELEAGQLRINQRISQAAVRRINALTLRLDRGLTGGDVADGAISSGLIDPVVSIVSATSPEEPPAASRTLTRPQVPSAGRVRLSAGQLRTNQRISQAAVRRANELLDRIATGLASGDLRDGTITADDLAAGVTQ